MSGRTAVVTALVAVCLCGPFPPFAARAELFVSPGVEAKTGYVSNRFAEPGGDGSLYAAFAPSLDITWFGPDEIEGGFSIQHTYTDYLRSGFTSANETTGRIDARKSFGALEASLSLAAGWYQDESLSEDDAVWVELSPTLRREITAALVASISAAVSRVHYDSRSNTGEDNQTETHWQARPGFRWSVAPAVAIWGEGSLEANDANDDTEDYLAAGLTAGLDFISGGAVSAGAWTQWIFREYLERSQEGSEDRRDTPLSLGAWASLRVRPWAEINAAGHWLWYRSTEYESDYDSWSLEAGLRFLFDWQPSSDANR